MTVASPFGEFLRQLRIAGLSPAPGGIYQALADDPRVRQAARAFSEAIREDERQIQQAGQDEPAQPEQHEINNTAVVTQVRPSYDHGYRTQRSVGFGFGRPQ